MHTSFIFISFTGLYWCKGLHASNGCHLSLFQLFYSVCPVDGLVGRWGLKKRIPVNQLAIASSLRTWSGWSGARQQNTQVANISLALTGESEESAWAWKHSPAHYVSLIFFPSVTSQAYEVKWCREWLSAHEDEVRVDGLVKQRQNSPPGGRCLCPTRNQTGKRKVNTIDLNKWATDAHRKRREPDVWLAFGP